MIDGDLDFNDKEEEKKEDKDDEDADGEKKSDLAMIRAMFQCIIVDDRTLEADARIEVVSTGKGGGFRVIQTQNQHTDAIDW